MPQQPGNIKVRIRPYLMADSAGGQFHGLKEPTYNYTRFCLSWEYFLLPIFLSGQRNHEAWRFPQCSRAKKYASAYFYGFYVAISHKKCNLLKILANFKIKNLSKRSSISGRQEQPREVGVLLKACNPLWYYLIFAITSVLFAKHRLGIKKRRDRMRG